MATETEIKKLTTEQEALLARMEASLKRGELGPDEAIESDGLAEQAARHGYTHLKSTQKDVADRNRVRAAFRALGIQPLDTESVERYQTEELTRKHRPTRQLVFSRRNLLGFPLLATCFMSVMLGMIISIAIPTHAPVVMAISVLVGSLVLLPALGWINAADGLRKFKWHSITLDSYEREIPRHILQRIVTIGDKLPEATFFVEELGEQRPDPFLKMILGRQGYYIDVWLEPDFNGPRVEI